MWFLPEHRQRRPDMAQRTARRPHHPAPPRLPQEKTRPHAGRPAADPPRGTRRTPLGAACPRQRQAQKITGHTPTRIASRFERETAPSPCHPPATDIPVRDVTPRNPRSLIGKVFQKGSVSMWLFHLHSAVKIRAFYPVFPSSESTTTVFCWLFHWNFREKASTYFLWHRQTKQPYAMTEPSKKALLPTWWKRHSSAHYAALNSPPQPAWGAPHFLP